jgi:transketolase
MKQELPDDWDASLPGFTPEDGKIATRKASGKALNSLASRVTELVGGSADLAGSNNSDIEDEDFFEAGRGGRNIHFGVREHAMGAAVNGMVLHGCVRPFGATFLIFSDYMRAAVRIAALMRVPSIFIFTHDSVGLGEDGPTHQPIEHLASLRAIPHLLTFRPCDANETIRAWRFIVQHREGPVALCLSRQGLPVLEATSSVPPPVEHGAYVLHDSSEGEPDVILIASGSEVQLIEEAREVLAARGVTARTVSMPCWELFEQQPTSYRDKVLPPSITARVAVEAASPFGWARWAGDKGTVIGLDRFGASAPGETVLAELGFTAQAVVDEALEVMGK